MNRYIKEIHINKLFHLQDISIPIADEKSPHLILTGKNGSGKTVLLNAIAEFLDYIKEDKNMYFLQYSEWIASAKREMEKYPENSHEFLHWESTMESHQTQYQLN